MLEGAREQALARTEIILLSRYKLGEMLVAAKVAGQLRTKDYGFSKKEGVTNENTFTLTQIAIKSEAINESAADCEHS
jgi:hypothetical protein